MRRQSSRPRLECEHRIRHADGSWRWVVARGMAERDPDGRPYRISGHVSGRGPGFLYSQPLDPEAATALLEAQNPGTNGGGG